MCKKLAKTTRRSGWNTDAVGEASRKKLNGEAASALKNYAEVVVVKRVVTIAGLETVTHTHVLMATLLRKLARRPHHTIKIKRK